MKQPLILLCSLFFFGIAIAQKAPIKWGKIASEDLAMTIYEPDPDADAVVLQDYGNISFDIFPSGPVYKLERIKRIKILKTSAFDRGNVTISYYKTSKTKFQLKAHIFQVDGTETQVPSNDIFDEKIYRSFHQKRVALPDVTEGSIIEYRYTITSPYLTQLPTWYFQEDIPIRASELHVNIPSWFEYARLFQGTDKLVVSETKPSTVNIGGGILDSQTSRYVAEKVEALQEEPFITTMNDYRMRIKFQLNGIQVPGRPYEPYMTTWEGFAEELSTATYFGQQYSKKKRVQPIQKAVESQLALLKTEAEKISFLHQYLTRNMEWDGDYDATININIDKAFELRRGNSAELNLMLLALLRANDIEAYPMLISTRSHGKIFPFYPFISQFNHVLVYAKLKDGKEQFLDIGDAVSPVYLPRIQSLNKQGLVILSEEKTEWMDIKPNKSKNVMMLNLKLDEEGILHGDVTCQHSGYSAVRERRNYADDTEGNYWVNRLEEQAVTAEVDKFEYDNLKDINKAFKGTITCSFPTQTQVVDDFIYLSPIIYSNFKENPFKTEKRIYPIEIAYPFSEQLIVNINIPEGYIVEELPENLNLQMPDKAAKCTYSISKKEENKLQIVLRAKVNKLIFYPEEYEGIKNFYDLISEKLQEQIVLKKKA